MKLLSNYGNKRCRQMDKHDFHIMQTFMHLTQTSMDGTRTEMALPHMGIDDYNRNTKNKSELEIQN
jgi:hypothetical protein